MAKILSSPESVRSVLDIASPNLNGKDMEISEDPEETRSSLVNDCAPVPPNGAPTNGNVSHPLDLPPSHVQGQVTHMTLSPEPTSLQLRSPLLKNGTHEIQSHGEVAGSKEAKVELIEECIPSGLVAADDKEQEVSPFSTGPLPPPLNGDVKDHVVGKGSSYPRLTSPPVRSHISLPIVGDFRVHSRRASQEDGEIPSSSTPPKQKQHSSFVLRSHTPPTQPRSFHVAPASPPISTPLSNASTQGRRLSQPPPPQSYRPQTQTQTPNSVALGLRPLPSGPRALRATNPMGHYPPIRSSSSSQSHFIPRGPSADRERLEWDRERGWPPRSRGRGGGSGQGWAR